MPKKIKLPAVPAAPRKRSQRAMRSTKPSPRRRATVTPRTPELDGSDVNVALRRSLSRGVWLSPDAVAVLMRVWSKLWPLIAAALAGKQFLP